MGQRIWTINSSIVQIRSECQAAWNRGNAFQEEIFSNSGAWRERSRPRDRGQTIDLVSVTQERPEKGRLRKHLGGLTVDDALFREIDATNLG